MIGVSKLACYLILLSAVCVLCVEAAGEEKPETVETAKPQTATITPWQYCFGCKETVNIYMQTIVNELLAMQKSDKPSRSVLEAAEIVDTICDNAHFHQFQPFAKYGCIKTISEGYKPFLDEFSGSTTASDMTIKADNFKRKRRICVKHIKACPAQEFKKANLTMKARTKCAACRIVGQEIETYKKSIAKGKSFSAFMDDSNFCNNLGYSYQPYAWVESVCDEMVEEHLDDIVDILRFNRQVASTGMTPSETATDMMCKEFFKCKKDGDDERHQLAGNEEDL